MGGRGAGKKGLSQLRSLCSQPKGWWRGRNPQGQDLLEAVISPILNCHNLPHGQTISEALMEWGGAMQDKIASDTGQDPSTLGGVF